MLSGCFSIPNNTESHPLESQHVVLLDGVLIYRGHRWLGILYDFSPMRLYPTKKEPSAENVFSYTKTRGATAPQNKRQHSPCGLLSEVKPAPGSVVVCASTVNKSVKKESGVGASVGTPVVSLLLLSTPVGVGGEGGSLLAGSWGASPAAGGEGAGTGNRRTVALRPAGCASSSPAGLGVVFAVVVVVVVVTGLIVGSSVVVGPGGGCATVELREGAAGGPVALAEIFGGPGKTAEGEKMFSQVSRLRDLK